MRAKWKQDLKIGDWVWVIITEMEESRYYSRPERLDEYVDHVVEVKLVGYTRSGKCGSCGEQRTEDTITLWDSGRHSDEVKTYVDFPNGAREKINEDDMYKTHGAAKTKLTKLMNDHVRMKCNRIRYAQRQLKEAKEEHVEAEKAAAALRKRLLKKLAPAKKRRMRIKKGSAKTLGEALGGK